MSFLTPVADATIQNSYRWRNDDGSESAATYAAAENTPITGATRDTAMRLRFGEANPGSESELLQKASLALRQSKSGLRIALLDSANGYAYFGVHGSPMSVVKVRLSDFSEVGSLTFNSGEDIVGTGVIDTVNGYAYFVTDTTPGIVVKVALGAGDATPTRVGAVTLEAGEQVRSGVIDVANGYAYFGTNTTPGSLVKVALGAGAAAPTRVGALTLNSGENAVITAAIDAANGYAYLPTYSSPARVVKVALGAGAALPTRVDSVTLNTGENFPTSSVIDATNGYLYLGTGTSPGIVVKVALGAGAAAPTRVGALTLNSGENSLNAATIDTTNGYAYFGTYTTPSAIVVKVELGAGAAAPTRVEAVTLASGLDRLFDAVMDVTNGVAYFSGKELSPGYVVKIAVGAGAAAPTVASSLILNGETFFRSGVIDTSNGYAYFGTQTSPGNVVKVRLSDFTRIGSVQLDPGEDTLFAATIDAANGYAYFGTLTSPGRVVKIALGAGDALPTRVGAVTLNSGENQLAAAVGDPANGYSYFTTSTSPGIVVKVAHGAGAAAPTRVDALILNSGENTAYAAIIDTAGGYAYLGTHTSPAIVVKVALGAGAAAPTRVDALTLNAGENSIYSGVGDVANGYAYFGTNTGPGQIIKVALGAGAAAPTRVGAVTLNSGEGFLNDAVIDPSRGHAYFNTNSVPGKLIDIALGTGSNAPTRHGVLVAEPGTAYGEGGVIDPATGYAYYGFNTTQYSVAKISLIPRPEFRLEYGPKTSSCAAVQNWTQVPATATTEYWQMASSAFVSDASATTDSAGVSNGATTFQAGKVMTASSQTAVIDLMPNRFTEVEYSFKATTGAPSGTYCFRLTNAGTPTYFTYDNYAEASFDHFSPTTTSLSPSTAAAGTGTTIVTVSGTNFGLGSVVRWNGSDRPTTFVSTTSLQATISQSDLSADGTVPVTVFNPAPGGGTSNEQTFTITVSNPPPTVSSVSPTSGTRGGAGFTLTVNGTNFLNTSVVRLNGSDRTTTYVSPTQLTASIPASDLSASGVFRISVFSPSPGGGASNAKNFSIAGGMANGANAVDVVGQWDADDATTYAPIYNKNGPGKRTGLNLGSNDHTGIVLDSANHRLFVADGNNNRVLVYNLNLNDVLSDHVPDFVLGQPTFNDSSLATTQAGMRLPKGLAFDAARNFLFVADSTNNRVVVYDVTSITNGELAVAVLGQSSYTSSTAATTQSGMSAPAGLAYDASGNRLFVADRGNTRVLVYDAATITNGENAVNVLGKPNFTSSYFGATQSEIANITGLAHDASGNRLFVADGYSNRVLVFDVASIADGENAVNVLGQANFTSNTSGTTQAILNLPTGLAHDASGNRLFVADSTNNRVVVYDVASITNGENAVNVLGQANFSSSSAATTQAGMSAPNGVMFDGTNKRLYVGDATNHRVLVHNVIATVNGQNAFDVVGQYDADAMVTPSSLTPTFTRGGSNGSTPLRASMSPSLTAGSTLIDTTNHRLFATDSNGGRRVLVYTLNADNTLPDQVPDFVLGQANFGAVVNAASQATTTFPLSLALDVAGGRLFVGDSNRVLVYDISSGITNGQNAAFVLGQPDFTSSTAALTQAGIGTAAGLAYDASNNRLFVAASSQNRVLVYDVASITNGENAVNVLGQANFTTSTASLTQAGMNSPKGLVYDASGNRLFVSDSSYNRILVFDVASIVDGENAVNVLGQSNFTTSTASATQSGMSAPIGLAYDASGNRLFSVQSSYNRVLVYDVATVTDGEAAVNVLGQSTYTATSSALTQSGLNLPVGASYDPGNGRLYVLDANSNNRILAFDTGAPWPSTTGLVPASRPAGNAQFTLTVNGANFSTNSVVRYDGASLATTYVSASQLTATVPAGNVLTAATASITVFTPGPGGGISNAQTFTVTNGNPVPAVTSISPISAMKGGAQFTLTVNGSGFADAAVVRFNGIDMATTVVSDTLLTATVPGTSLSASGMFPVTVFNPSPAGGTSNGIDFSVGLIVNGQNAGDVAGQWDADVTASFAASFTKGALNGGTNRTGINIGTNSVSSVALDSVNHRLFVPDAGNNRVLVYLLDGTDTLVDLVPDFVLGQPNFNTNSSATTQAGMNGPRAVLYDAGGNRLFVSEFFNTRVLVYDVASITNGENAVAVLGQTLYTTSGTSLTQAGMSSPSGLAYDASTNRLFVGDSGYNRVTVYDVASITNGENAVAVLGQANYTTSTASLTQGGMGGPHGLAYDAAGNRLFVANNTYNRVTVYDVASITNGENAVAVLGQANYTTSTASLSQSGMSGPMGVAYDASGNRLFVANVSYNRVTVYDVASITNGEAAVNVLGQANFTTSTSATTQAGMSAPRGLAFDGLNNRLYVLEGTNNRILIHSTSAVADGQSATGVIGQYDADAMTTPGTLTPFFTKGVANSLPNRVGLNFSGSTVADVLIDTVGHRLFVSDALNNRVLVYNLSVDNILLDQVADFVLGQPNFNVTTAALTQAGMSSPRGLAFDSAGNRLFVANFSYGRVLVYDVASITNGEAAVNVLGQANFTSSPASLTQAGMNTPTGVVYDATGSRLFVADSSYNRVTVYDVASITDGENAVAVLGQANYTTSTASLSQSGMSAPAGVAYDAAGNRLFVANSSHNRILVYDVASITDGENAVAVLGQANYTTSTASLSQSGMSAPTGIAYDAAGKRLFVASSSQNRVLVFDVASITDGENAVNVLGQSTYTTSAAATTQAGMNNPRAVGYDGGNGRLYVSDTGNNRILVHEVIAPASTSSSCGATTVTLSAPNGGTSHAVGDSIQALWSSGGCPAQSGRLLLSKDGGATYPIVIADGIPVSSGSYSWQATDAAAGTALRMKIELLANGSTVLASDASDSDFSVAQDAATAGTDSSSTTGTSSTSGSGGTTASEPAPTYEPPVETFVPPPVADTSYEPLADALSVPTVSVQLGLAPSNASDASSCMPDTLLKGSREPIYYCGSDRMRHWFPTEKIFLTWYPDFSSVITMDEESLQLIPLGADVTYRPGTWMIKSATDPKVYAITKDNVLRWVTTESVAAALFGPSWNTKIDVITQDQLSRYAIGAPITWADPMTFWNDSLYRAFYLYRGSDDQSLSGRAYLALRSTAAARRGAFEALVARDATQAGASAFKDEIRSGFPVGIRPDIERFLGVLEGTATVRQYDTFDTRTGVGPGGKTVRTERRLQAFGGTQFTMEFAGVPPEFVTGAKLRLRGALIVGAKAIVPDGRGTVEILSEPATTVTGKKKVAVIKMSLTGVPAQSVSVDVPYVMFTQASNVRALFAAASNNKLDLVQDQPQYQVYSVSVPGTVGMPAPAGADCHAAAWDLEDAARKEAAKAGFYEQNFDYVIYAYQRAPNDCWADVSAVIGGKTINLNMWKLLADNGLANGTTAVKGALVHGLTAAFGLASSDGCSLTDPQMHGYFDPNELQCSRDLGDPFDAAGFRIMRPDGYDNAYTESFLNAFSAFQKSRLGWMEPTDVKTLPQGGSVTLNPVEGTGLRAAKVPVVGRDGSALGYYLVEFRGSMANPANPTSLDRTQKGVVLVRFVRSDRATLAYRYMGDNDIYGYGGGAKLNADQYFRDRTGIMIYFTGRWTPDPYGPTLANVTVVMPPALSVLRSGPGAAASSVVSAPSGIECSATKSACSASFGSGTVSLTPAPAPGAALASIYADLPGALPQVQTDYPGGKALTVLAKFHRRLLDVVLVGMGEGTVSMSDGSQPCTSSCATSFDTKGSAPGVTLRAVPSAGSRFVRWLGACSGTTDACTVAVEGDVAAYAEFAPQ